MGVKWFITAVSDKVGKSDYEEAVAYTQGDMLSEVARLMEKNNRVTITKGELTGDGIVYIQQKDMHYVIIDGQCEISTSDYRKAKRWYNARRKELGR